MQDNNESKISKFYDGKNIFVTGATGFMGKVLVEKLLRDCSGLNCIYILIRNKRGRNSETRRVDFINHLVFDHLQKNNPDSLKKIIAVSGDVSVDNLGLNEADTEMLIENANIVFHCAANVRFDQTLREAINFNTNGTLRMLKLAEQMKSLQVFVHVSTTYCHCRETVLEERYYPATENPFGIIEMVNVLKNETLVAITPKIIEGLPNTYAYSKGLTEDIVHEYMSKFKIAIVRPSVVTAAWKVPVEGWIEGLNGPTGITLVAAKGVLRSMYCNPNYRSQMIPVDIAINMIIAVAYQRSLMLNDSEYYCNIADYTENPMTWGDALETSRRILGKYPLTQMLWYPDGSIKSNYYHHLLCSVLFHYLPAYFIDLIMILGRQKPFLVNIHKRISLGLKVLQYYTTRDWVFKSDNCMKVYEDLSAVDKEKFYCNLKEIDMNIYFKKYLIGIRQFIAKDSPESLPQARRTYKILYYVDRTIKCLLIALIIYIILRMIIKRM